MDRSWVIEGFVFWYRPDPGSVAIHPGDILAGYRVTRLLGRGGMGEVWAATSEGLDLRPGALPKPRRVAIKVLLARAAVKPDLVRRFQREAEAAAAIKSPFVCQLVEVGETDEGAHLLVFEHLTGESLADRLKREQYLPLSEVGPILDDVLQGLAAAHAAGVIHRDLKPGNLFLETLEAGPTSYAPPSGGFGYSSPPPPSPGDEPRAERAKILDFGISKLTRREKEEPTLTAFDATLGSFAYMAPEQVRGAARADERADIYALGAVAFRALSGRLPFEGATAAMLVAMKLDRAAPSLEDATGGEKWPAGVERFLERALERRRERRYATAQEALAAWREIQPAHVTRAVPRPRTATVQPEAELKAPTPPPPPPPRPPIQSFIPEEDNPTEVDGPPTMTVDAPAWAFAQAQAQARARASSSRPPPAGPPAPTPSDPQKRKKVGK